MQLVAEVIKYFVCFVVGYDVFLVATFRFKYGRNWYLRDYLWERFDQWRLSNLTRTLLTKWNTRKRKKATMKTVTLYTDGACSGNPGPGGCSGGAANLSLWENAAKGGKRGSERSNFAAAS